MDFLVVYYGRTIHYERVLGYSNGDGCILPFIYFMILKSIDHGIYLGASRNTVAQLWYISNYNGIWYHPCTTTAKTQVNDSSWHCNAVKCNAILNVSESLYAKHRTLLSWQHKKRNVFSFSTDAVFKNAWAQSDKDKQLIWTIWKHFIKPLTVARVANMVTHTHQSYRQCEKV